MKPGRGCDRDRVQLLALEELFVSLVALEVVLLGPAHGFVGGVANGHELGSVEAGQDARMVPAHHSETDHCDPGLRGPREVTAWPLTSWGSQLLISSLTACTMRRMSASLTAGWTGRLKTSRASCSDHGYDWSP